MLQVDFEGRSYSLGEFLELFNRVATTTRCRALEPDGTLCANLGTLRQGSHAEPRCLEHAWVRRAVN